MNVSLHQSGTPPRPRNRSASNSPPRSASRNSPFLRQHDDVAADDQYDDQGNLFNSVTFAELAAEARALDPDGEPYEFIGDIQPQQSNVSSVEPQYHRHPNHLARYQNAHYGTGNRYQNFDESSDDDDDDEEERNAEFDYNELTRRANNNSYSVPILDNGANKKGKLKKDEDDVSVVHNDFDNMSMSISSSKFDDI